ncbi:MAG TPA: hypothetical protein VFK14_05145 [Solirubrobacterales bacterium]|nr:hypothetical protein [Solirubrobacterales bacterium]
MASFCGRDLMLQRRDFSFVGGDRLFGFGQTGGGILGGGKGSGEQEANERDEQRRCCGREDFPRPRHETAAI